MGKGELESQIHEEIRAYLDVMQKHAGTPYDVTELIDLAMTNLIHAMVLGKRCAYDDQEFRYQVAAMKTRLRSSMQSSSTDNIPFINWLPGDLTEKAKLRTATEATYDYLVKCIREHKKNLDPSNPKGYMAHYLLKMQQEAGQETYFDGQFLNSKKVE